MLRTNTKLSAEEVALKYKQLWIVEQIFRTVKSILTTRPIFHKCDETIRGQVFCSFLAMVLLTELQQRLETKGLTLEWQDVIRDVNRLEEIDLETDGKHFRLRSASVGCCGKVFQAVSVALPPTIQQCESFGKEDTDYLRPQLQNDNLTNAGATPGFCLRNSLKKQNLRNGTVADGLGVGPLR